MYDTLPEVGTSNDRRKESRAAEAYISAFDDIEPEAFGSMFYTKSSTAGPYAAVRRQVSAGPDTPAFSPLTPKSVATAFKSQAASTLISMVPGLLRLGAGSGFGIFQNRAKNLHTAAATIALPWRDANR